MVISMRLNWFSQISFLPHKYKFNFHGKCTWIRGHSITTWARWGGKGSKNVCFCPRSWYKNCPRRGEGVRKWQNSVHVVVEWPLSNNNFTVTFTRCNVAFEMVIMYYHGLDFFLGSFIYSQHDNVKHDKG